MARSGFLLEPPRSFFLPAVGGARSLSEDVVASLLVQASVELPKLSNSSSWWWSCSGRKGSGWLVR